MDNDDELTVTAESGKWNASETFPLTSSSCLTSLSVQVQTPLLHLKTKQNYTTSHFDFVFFLGPNSSLIE